MTRLALALLCIAVTACDDQQCLATPQADIVANELRDPLTGVCQPYGNGGCGDPCSPCETAKEETEPYPDWASCYTSCEGLTESTCKSTSGCRAVYAAGSFHQCWATAPSGPIQGGTCAGLDAYACSRHDDCVAMHAAGSPIGTFMSCAAESSVQDPGSCVGAITCTTPQPSCPANTLPGRANGCWTGYCIPIADCDALPSCEDLLERDCIGRSDCKPTYAGVNCTCTSTGCSCQSVVFDACETR